MSSSGFNTANPGGQTGRTRSVAAPAVASGSLTAPALLALFLLCLLPAFYIFLGDMRLTPTRIFLLLTFLPFAFKLLTKGAGPLHSIDICFMLFMVWMTIVLTYHHGTVYIPLTGINIVETFGGYMVGRVLVRNEADFRFFFRIFLLILMCLCPFVVLELVTDRNIIQELSREIGQSFFKGNSSRGRMGLFRVMAGFEHPILYGLFCSLGFAPVFYIYRKKFFTAAIALGFVGFMTFAALSSAPLLAVGVQFFLVAWALLTGARWWPLIIILSILYVTVDMLSNRTPITILINYVTFDPNTAWGRVNIWTFGSAEVLRHPLMGIGFGEWIRPDWLGSSVDNFWLLTAMRFGFPGIILFMGGLALMVRSIVKTKGLSPEADRYRTGYLISLAGLCFSLTTVHVWGNSSSFTMMFFGMGVWFIEAGRKAGELGAEPATDIPAPRRLHPEAVPLRMQASPDDHTPARGNFSRFPQVHRRKDPPGQVG